MDRNEYVQRMKTFFGNDPKEDASTNTSIVVDPIHIENGIKGNPWACAIAAACQDRGIQAIILKDVAWVKVPDPHSPTKYVNLRYRVGTSLHKQFDRGEQVDPVLVTFRAPTKAETLVNKRKVRTASRIRIKAGQAVVARGPAPRGEKAKTYSPPRGVQDA